MCKKDLISVPPNAVSLYQLCDDEADGNETQLSPVIIQMDISATPPQMQPIKISTSQVSVKIPCESFDVIARDWCKRRELNTNKYTLEEILSQCNFQWPIDEKALINGLDEWVEDLSLAEQVKEREQQDKKEAVLHFDNIFDVIADEAEHKRALDTIEMLLEDYDNNSLLIDALSCAIARYEQQ